MGDILAAIWKVLQPAVIFQLCTYVAATIIVYLETLDENTRQARLRRRASVVVLVLGFGATYWAQRDSRELQDTLDEVKAGNTSLKSSNETLLAGNVQLQRQLADSSRELASANAEIRKLYAQQVAMEREQRVLTERFVARTDDLAGRVSGDNSFVFLQVMAGGLKSVWALSAAVAIRCAALRSRSTTIPSTTLYTIPPHLSTRRSWTRISASPDRCSGSATSDSVTPRAEEEVSRCCHCPRTPRSRNTALESPTCNRYTVSTSPSVEMGIAGRQPPS